ncbi:MAG TPA: alpha/beta hydrolase [Mycobacteriales bacterium]|nr:alpha/beta hydrolase [Mycobacteriales bacterium]
MATATIDGLTLAYEVIGEAGRTWTITPGGRFSKDDPGIHEFATALADFGNRVLIWDRPNCGASDLCFEGDSESAMQADALAGLLRHLDLGPAIFAGGSGGARVSMLAAERHPDLASGLAIWWISGGIYGLISVGSYYCGASIAAAWQGGMPAVAELPDWAPSFAQNSANRDRMLAQDRDTFIATLERWLLAYCPCGDVLVPGLSESDAQAIGVPTLVFRSGTTDLHHRRETSERIAAVLPNATLVEPPWGDSEWNERGAARTSGAAAGLFVRWHLLAPMLNDWAASTLG